MGLLEEQGFVGKQAAFHRSPAKGRMVIAGNQAGKTEGEIREAAWHATGTHPFREVRVPSVGWMFGLDHEVNRNILFPRLMEYLPRGLVRRTTTRAGVAEINLTNGSMIHFKSYEAGWTKCQAAQIDWASFDEEPPDKKLHSETMVRLMARGGSWWLAMTPLLGKTWVYTDLVRPALSGEKRREDLELFNWSVYENTSLARADIDRAMADTPVELRAARIYGRFIDVTGLVWPQFDENVHVVEPFNLDPTWPIVVGLDPGYRHPFGAVFLAVKDDGELVVFADYRRRGLLIAQHAKNLVGILEEHAPHAINHRVVKWAFEPMTSGPRHDHEDDVADVDWVIDRTAAQFRRELAEYGIRARESESEMRPGLDRVGELFMRTANGRPGLVLMRGRVPHLVEELRMYSWKPVTQRGAEEKEKPQDRKDDCVDPLRYAVMSKPMPRAVDEARVVPGSFAALMAEQKEVRRIAGMQGNEKFTQAEIASWLGDNMWRSW